MTPLPTHPADRHDTARQPRRPARGRIGWASRIGSWCLILAGLTPLGGCAIAPTHSALQAPYAPALVPARTFFANTRSHGGYQISPDGRQLAWVGVFGPGPAVFVKALDEPGAVDRMVGPGVGGFQWAADSRHLLTLSDGRGNENTHVLAFDTRSPEPLFRDLTPWPGVKAVVYRVRPEDPDHLLVLHNRRDRRVFDLVRLSLTSGAETLLARNPGDAIQVVADRRGEPLAVVRRQGDQLALHQWQDGGSGRAIARWRSDELVDVIGADPAGGGFYLVSGAGRERRALVRLDAASGAETVLAEDPRVDIEGAQISALTLRPLLAVSHPDYPRIHWLDGDWQREIERWFPTAPRRLLITSTSADGQRATLQTDEDEARHFWLLDRAAGRLTRLGGATLNEARGQLGVTRPVALTARDGLPLHGYLTLPNDHRPGTPRPLVLLVHGGPWARNHWEIGLGTPQFLANRGYAVLQVNYRGSTGYGRRFMEAAVGEFAGRMHDDLIDAVDWAVREGVADRDRVAIMGASYGGYATLVGLSFTPDTFACGVDIVGVTDLARLVETFPAYWDVGLPTWHRYVGNPAVPEERARMLAKSPLSRVDAIRRPLLVIQTANDVRVPQEQSDRLVTALRARGQPVDYRLYADAGHLFSSWSWGTRLRAHRVIEDFLAGCLGGRSGGFDAFELAAWWF